MNNRGQIGQAITWFVGIVVVFFAIIIFLVAVLVLSGSKALFEKDEIILDKTEINIDSQKVLIYLLNGKMDNERSVKSFIQDGIKNPNLIRDPLTLVIEDKLDGRGRCDYSFLIEYDPDNLKLYSKQKGVDLTYRKIEIGNIANQKFVNGQEGLSFFAGDVRVRTKFYLGECRNE
tara:strand:- start:1069 stop:1593 length:525 start_codon:yes stop_codon:yes gene_type:complete